MTLASAGFALYLERESRWRSSAQYIPLLCTVLSDTTHKMGCVMAHRKRHREKSQSVSRTGRVPLEQMRDLLTDRSRLLPRRFAVPSLQSIINRQIEDLRHDNSDHIYDNRIGPVYRRSDGSVAEIERRVVRPSDLQRQKLFPQMRNVFRDSKGTMVCIRRRARRAVMFALRKTGKVGAQRNRQAVWTDKSRIVCKKSR